MRRFLASLAVGVVAVTTVGCASSRPPRPAFPLEDDPCASYCLVWVPPTYRDVPTVCRKEGCVQERTICVQKTVFKEVVKPRQVIQHCVPDECRETAIVQTKPGKDTWVRTRCNDCRGCECGQECFKKIHCPPQYGVCTKRETVEGFTYCTEVPPEYTVVAETVTCPEKRREHLPATYGVKWRKECFMPGHWAWEKRYCEDDCPPRLRTVCTPQPGPVDLCPAPDARCRSFGAPCPSKD